MASTFLLHIVLLTLLTKDLKAKIGLIKADLGNQESQFNSKGGVFCMDYHNNYAPMPPSYVGKTSIPVANYIFTQGCVEDDYKNIADKIVAIDSGNCTTEEKAAIIQRLHGKAALIIMNENTSDILPIDSTYHDINITVVTMFLNDFVSLMTLDSQVKIWFYAPEDSYFDPSLILLLCPATIGIVLASCWSASMQNKKTSHERHSFKDGKEGKEVNKEIEDSVKDGKDCTVLNKEIEDSVKDGKDCTVLNKEIEDSVKEGKGGKEKHFCFFSSTLSSVSLFEDSVEEKKQKCWKMNLMKKKEKMIECMFMAMPILLPVGGVAFVIYFIYKFISFLYNFCSYFDYIMTKVFSLLGVNGIFNAFFPLWNKLLPCNERPFLHNFFLLLLAIGVVVAWIIVRNESYAWVFQDIIGFFICIQIICSNHLSNFKVCCDILFLFLVFDVFMYISPICTNMSIVVGANFTESQLIEMNPMIMILPYFTTRPLLECTNKQLYSGLGLMYIIIPGLVISHNCAFDLNIHYLLRRRCHFIYFISSTVAYVVGLLLAMTSAIIMGSIQPALLYIGPCIILTTVIIAAIRGDLGCMWRGDLKLDICHHVTSEMCVYCCSILFIFISLVVCRREGSG